MKKLLLFLFATATLSAGPCINHAGGGVMPEQTLKVFYYPFALETFHPITTRDIESRARCRFVLDESSDDARRLLGWTNDIAPGLIDQKFIRVKITASRTDIGDIYVDRLGGVLKAVDNQQGRVDEQVLRQLQSMMDRLSAERGCKTD